MDRNQEDKICPSCEQIGEINQLKYFYININEMVLKCSSSNCMFPFNNFKYKYVDDDPTKYPPIRAISRESHTQNTLPNCSPLKAFHTKIEGSDSDLASGKLDPDPTCSFDFTNIAAPNGIHAKKEEKPFLTQFDSYETVSSTSATSSEKTESTNLTISRYLESLKAKQKKLREATKVRVKVEKDTKRIPGFIQNTSLLNYKKNTSKPLDFIRKIQQL